MGTYIIGSRVADYHVEVEDFEHRPGEVRLRLLECEGLGMYIIDGETWLPLLPDATEHQAAVESVATEMIENARNRAAMEPVKIGPDI